MVLFCSGKDTGLRFFSYEDLYFVNTLKERESSFCLDFLEGSCFEFSL